MTYFAIVVFSLAAIVSGWQVALGESTQIRRAYAPFLVISVLMIMLYIIATMEGRL